MKPVLGLGFALNAPANPLALLDNIISQVDFFDASRYVFKSGTTVDSVAPTLGTKAFDDGGAGNEPIYDSTAFSGRGGLKIADASDYIFYSSDFSASAVQTLGYVVNIPAYTAEYDLHHIGNTTTGNANARIIVTTAEGRISYGRNQANGFTVVYNSGALLGKTFVIARYNSASSLDVFVNSISSVTNLDPTDTYSTLARVYIGARAAASATGKAGAQYGQFFHTSDALTDTEIQGIFTYWQAFFS